MVESASGAAVPRNSTRRPRPSTCASRATCSRRSAALVGVGYGGERVLKNIH